MKKRIAAAVLGVFLATPFVTACSDHNIIDDSASETITEVVTDKDGNSKEILKASDIENTDFIYGICTADDRLFVSGGSGAFRHSLAEIDENGKVTDMIHSDK